jgi:hypothetical protein
MSGRDVCILVILRAGEKLSLWVTRHRTVGFSTLEITTTMDRQAWHGTLTDAERVEADELLDQERDARLREEQEVREHEARERRAVQDEPSWMRSDALRSEAKE